MTKECDGEPTIKTRGVKTTKSAWRGKWFKFEGCIHIERPTGGCGFIGIHGEQKKLPKWFDRTTNEYVEPNGASREFEIMIRPKKQKVYIREEIVK